MFKCPARTTYQFSFFNFYLKITDLFQWLHWSWDQNSFFFRPENERLCVPLKIVLTFFKLLIVLQDSKSMLEIGGASFMCFLTFLWQVLKDFESAFNYQEFFNGYCFIWKFIIVSNRLNNSYVVLDIVSTFCMMLLLSKLHSGNRNTFYR